MLKFLILLLTTIIGAQGTTFTKCSLAKELARHSIPRSDIKHYVCMAQHESSFHTGTISRANSDGSHDHGLFQINDYWNCDPQNGRSSKNGCGHHCSDFRDSDITDDLECVLKLKREHNGFGFSYAWRDNCQHISDSYLSGCLY